MRIRLYETQNMGYPYSPAFQAGKQRSAAQETIRRTGGAFLYGPEKKRSAGLPVQSAPYEENMRKKALDTETGSVVKSRHIMGKGDAFMLGYVMEQMRTAMTEYTVEYTGSVFVYINP